MLGLVDVQYERVAYDLASGWDVYWWWFRVAKAAFRLTSVISCHHEYI